MTIRLSISSLAGMARTLVAVGTSSDADMFLTTAAAAPRSTCTSSPSAGGGVAGFGGRAVAARGAGCRQGAAVPAGVGGAAWQRATGLRPVARGGAAACASAVAGVPGWLGRSARGCSQPGTRASSDPPTRGRRGTCGTSPRPAIRFARMVNLRCSRPLFASIPLSCKRIARRLRLLAPRLAGYLTPVAARRRFRPIKANASPAIRQRDRGTGAAASRLRGSAAAGAG